MDFANLKLKVDSTDIDEAEKGLDGLTKAGGRAEKATDSLTTKSAKLSRQLDAVATVTAGVIVATGAAAAASVVSLAKTSKEIENLSLVASASTDEFQKISFASKRFGLESEKVADILKDVNDKIGDFLQTGGGPMADFFENIAPQVGVTADEFKRLSGPEALQLYVSSLEKANLSQAEMTFFMEAIASDATLLLPLLEDNGRQLKELSNQAERVGIVISEIDLLRLREFDRHLDDLTAASEGLVKQLTLGLVPSVGAITKMLIEASNETLAFGGAAALVGDTAQSAIGAIGNTVEEMILGWKESKAQVAEFAAELLKIGANLDQFFSLGGLNKSLAESAKVQSQYAAAYESLGKHYRSEFEKGFNSRENEGSFSDRFNDQVAEDKKRLQEQIESRQSSRSSSGGTSGLLEEEKALLKQFERLEASLNRQVALYGETGEAAAINYDLTNGALVGLNQTQSERLLGLAKELDALDAQKEFAEQVSSALEESLPASQQKIQDLKADILLLTMALDEGQITADQYAEAVSNIRVKIADVEADAAAESNNIGDALAQGMQDVVSDGFVSIWKGGFDDVLAGFGEMLIQMALEAAAADLVSAIGLGGKDNTGGNLGDLFGGLFTGFKDAGGPIGAGQFAVVGERRPEIITGPANVIGGAETAKLMQGGNTTNNNITFVASSNEKANTKALGQLQRQLNQTNAASARYT